MKFGLFKEFPSRDDVTEKQVFEESFALVDAAEDMGVEQMWLAEYHFNPIRSVLSAPITVASAIAARTKRMKIGLAVHVLPLRNPVIVAEEIATLDHISQGRLDFGIGRSTFPTTYDAYGIPYSESRERFQECLDIILKGWTTERFSYEGQYYKFQNVCVVPKPFQKPHPPISVGATSAETFQMVGQMGYPILINPSRGFTLLGMAPYIRQYRQAWQEAGHQGQAEVGLRVPVYVAETADRAYSEPQESTMYQMRRLASVIGTSGLHAGVSAISHDDRNAQADLLADMSYDDVLRDKVIYGTPEGVVERLRQLEEELELTQIIYEVNFGCLIPYELQFNCLKLMMERVVPEFS